jgi:hypothetical protein
MVMYQYNPYNMHVQKVKREQKKSAVNTVTADAWALVSVSDAFWGDGGKTDSRKSSFNRYIQRF